MADKRTTKPPNSHQHPIVRKRISEGMAKAKATHGPRKRTPKAERRRRLAERKAKLEGLRTAAVKAGLVEHGMSPTQVLQRLIDDALIEYVTEQDKHTKALQDGQRTSANLIRRLRREAAYYASLALQYNIADRQTRIMERQAQAWITVLNLVFRDPEVNLSEAKIRRIAALIPEKAAEVEALAEESAQTGDKRLPPHALRLVS